MRGKGKAQVFDMTCALNYWLFRDNNTSGSAGGVKYF